MSDKNRIAQRFCDFPEWPKIRQALAEQLKLQEWELERIGDEVVGDSLGLVEAVMVLEEAYGIHIPL